MKLKISTTDLPQGDSVEFWRSWLNNELHPMSVSDYDPANFWVQCELASFGEIEFIDFKASGQTFHRPQSLIRPSHSDYYILAIVDTAPDVVEHNGYTTTCANGDILLLDTGRPYVLGHTADIGVTSINIPRRVLESALGPTERAAGLAVDGQSATGRVLRNHLRSLAQNVDALDPSAARRMSLIAVDLIAASFEQRLALEGRPRNRQGAVIVRAQSFIDGNLADPDLDFARVAAFVGVSPRRLHEIFADEQRSVMDYLWERRLMRAGQLLNRDVGQQVPIASVGYRVGFISPAHFARRFRQHFGMTPSEYRERGRRPAGESGEAGS